MCTGIKLVATDSSVIYARTMEFGQNTESNILIIPRAHVFSGTTPDGSPGLSWHSKYAACGANMLNIMHLVDGINEQGLAGGLFYFPGYAEYQTIEPKDAAHTIAPWELVTWMLTNFATVAQVKDAITSINVAPVTFGPWGIVPPVHAIVHDATGTSMVIEYVHGQLKLYDNPIGAFSNAPTFDWHLTNLNNYVGISSHNKESKELSGTRLTPFGQGSGMFGLPGDFTPPSRFIRAVAFSQAVPPAPNADQACASAFHILNLFNIPIGVVADYEQNTVHYDYTQWTTACDLSRTRYLWHTYENSTLHMIDIGSLATDCKQARIIAMHNPATIVDTTPCT